MAAKRKSAYFAVMQDAQRTAPTETRTQTIQTARQPDSGADKQPRIKATFYLAADDIITIDTMQTNHFRLHGKKPEKSELVSKAIVICRN